VGPFLFDAAFCAVSGEYVLMCTLRTVGYWATAVHLSFGVDSPIHHKFTAHTFVIVFQMKRSFSIIPNI
jgi:hypothetical protein